MKTVNQSCLNSKSPDDDCEIRKPEVINKIELVAEIVRDHRLSHAERSVAITMLTYFHKTTTGKCFPSYRQIADEAGVARSTATVAIPKLKALGYVSFDQSNGGRNKPNAYHFKRVRPSDPLRAERVRPADPHIPRELNPVKRERAPSPLPDGIILLGLFFLQP